MLKIMGTAAVVCAMAASFSFAAGLPAHSINGNYMEARTADVYTGPCFANDEAEINGKEAVFGWTSFAVQTRVVAPQRLAGARVDRRDLAV